MSESSRTSGSFIQPRWKREPNTVERTVSMLMTLMALAAFVCSTVLAGGDGREIKEAADKLRKSADAIKTPLATLSATTGGEAKAGRYAQGRQVLTGKLTAFGQKFKSDAAAWQYLPWIIIGLMAVVGVVFCFLGWQVRRVTAALFGAVLLGGTAFVISYASGAFGLSGSIVLALPPAFLGALLAWTYVMLITTFQVGMLLLVPFLLAVVWASSDKEMLRWLIPVSFSLWALLAALTYLFLVRAALISLMSVLGALLLTNAGFLILTATSDVKVPWEAALAMVAFFAIIGNLTQYHYAGGGKGDDDADEDGGSAKKKLKPKLKPA